MASLLYYKEAVWYLFEKGARKMPIRAFELLNYKINDPEMAQHLANMRDENANQTRHTTDEGQRDEPTTDEEQRDEPTTDEEQRDE